MKAEITNTMIAMNRLKNEVPSTVVNGSSTVIRSASNQNVMPSATAAADSMIMSAAAPIVAGRDQAVPSSRRRTWWAEAPFPSPPA